jgi:hypothetical protein
MVFKRGLSLLNSIFLSDSIFQELTMPICEFHELDTNQNRASRKGMGGREGHLVGGYIDVVVQAPKGLSNNWILKIVSEPSIF